MPQKGNQMSTEKIREIINKRLARVPVDSIDFVYVGNNEYSDLGINFDPEAYDEEEQGVLYGDEHFLNVVRKFLIKVGVPQDLAMDVMYSEGGMQDHGRVSCDANALIDYYGKLALQRNGQ